MRLRHIEIFQAVMQHGSISAAAKALSISQPAATKLLQSVERSLGVALFQRVGGRLVATADAQRLFVETDTLNHGLQKIQRLAANLRTPELAALDIAATATMALNFAPVLCGHLRKQFPALRLRLSSTQTQGVVESLLLRTAQVGLTLNDPCHPSISARLLASSALMVIAPAGTWSAAECAQPLPIAALPENLIGFDESSPVGSQVARCLALCGHEQQFLTVVHSAHMASAMVEAGHGYAVVDPVTAAAPNARIQARVLEPALPIGMYLLTLSNDPSPFAGGAVVKLFEEAARALLGQMLRP